MGGVLVMRIMMVGERRREGGGRGRREGEER